MIMITEEFPTIVPSNPGERIHLPAGKVGVVTMQNAKSNHRKTFISEGKGEKASLKSPKTAKLLRPALFSLATLRPRATEPPSGEPTSETGMAATTHAARLRFSSLSDPLVHREAFFVPERDRETR